MFALPANAALVIVDVQQGFDDPSWGKRNNPDAEANVARLLAAWRRTRRPVHHVVHSSRAPTGVFLHTKPGHRVKPEAAPLPGEPVHVKQVNSSFIGTQLERDLRDAHIDTVVVVGLTTPHCVSTTTRMAGNLGFNTFVVQDATAAFERRALDGSMREPNDVHLTALSDLAEEFATITQTNAVLGALGDD